MSRVLGTKHGGGRDVGNARGWACILGSDRVETEGVRLSSRQMAVSAPLHEGAWRKLPLLQIRRTCIVLCRVWLLFGALHGVQVFHDCIQDGVARALGEQPVKRAAGLTVLLLEALAGHLPGHTHNAAGPVSSTSAQSRSTHTLLVQTASQLAGPLAVWVLCCFLLVLQLRSTGLVRAAFSTSNCTRLPVNEENGSVVPSRGSPLDDIGCGAVTDDSKLWRHDESDKSSAGETSEPAPVDQSLRAPGPPAAFRGGRGRRRRHEQDGQEASPESSINPAELLGADGGPPGRAHPEWARQITEGAGASHGARPPFRTGSPLRAIRAAARLVLHVLGRLRWGDVFLPYRPLRCCRLLGRARLEAASGGHLLWMAISGSILQAALGLMPWYPGGDGARLLCLALDSRPASWGALSVTCSAIERATLVGAAAAVALFTLWDVADSWRWLRGGPLQAGRRRAAGDGLTFELPEGGSSGIVDALPTAGRRRCRTCGRTMLLRSACHEAGEAACRYDWGPGVTCGSKPSGRRRLVPQYFLRRPSVAGESLDSYKYR
jgi:hypothetical protein